MPTLNNPSERARIPIPLTGISSRSPVTTGDKILVNGVPAASTGNTTNDHIEELLARSGHGSASAYATETDYAVGDEVYWRDGTTARELHFYIRLTAGQDPSGSTPNNLPNQWREVVNSLNDIPVDGDASQESLLVRTGGHGAVRAEVGQYQRLQNAQTAAQVSASVNAAIDSIVNLARWRGAWEGLPTQYQSGEYIVHNNRYFRALNAVSSNSGPASDGNNWTELSGVERLSVIRMRNMAELLVESLDLDPAAANRGRWVVRNRTDEEYAYTNPPMQFFGAWAAGSTYYFGAVVLHDEQLWALTPAATITTGKTGAATEPGTDTDWRQIGITVEHPVNQNVDNLREDLQRIHELLIDLHLGTMGHPGNYALDDTANAGIAVSANAYNLAAARAQTGLAKSVTVPDTGNNRYILVVLPHGSDSRLWRLHVVEGNSHARYFQVSQIWNVGNSASGTSLTFYSLYQQAPIPPGATVRLEKAGSVDHTGTTEFSGIANGTINGEFGTDSAVELTEAEYYALADKKQVFYLISDA